MSTSRRLLKINKHIQRVFGEILQEEAEVPANVLVTIARVDTTPNLKRSIIWLYIYPLAQAEEVLKQLKPQMYDLQGSFNRLLDMRPLPRLSLRIDYGAEHAEHIERTLAELKTDQPAETTPPSPSDR
jgi:ribosome-binding factor A